jgi:hypothetical protein
MAALRMEEGPLPRSQRAEKSRLPSSVKAVEAVTNGASFQSADNGQIAAEEERLVIVGLFRWCTLGEHASPRAPVGTKS